jgi:hypothetical protein
MSTTADAYGFVIAAALSSTPRTAAETAMLQMVLNVNKAPTPPSPDLKLPWQNSSFRLFEVTEKKIRFLIAILAENEAPVRAAVPVIAAAIIRFNGFIELTERRLSTCFISDVNSTFALWNGRPVILMDELVKLSEATQTVHEMGHAVYDALARLALTRGPRANRALALRILLGDLFVRLGGTRETDLNGRGIPCGLLMVDPSEWSPGTPPEHPWEDPDEFFASALEAYQIDREALDRSVTKWSAFDASIAVLAKELLALLQAFVQGDKPPGGKLSQERTNAAEEELRRPKSVNTVESSPTRYGLSDSSEKLRFLLDPTKRPAK